MRHHDDSSAIWHVISNTIYIAKLQSPTIWWRYNSHLLHSPLPQHKCALNKEQMSQTTNYLTGKPQALRQPKRNNYNNKNTINSNQCHSSVVARGPRTDAKDPFLPSVLRRGGPEVQWHPLQPPLPDTHMVQLPWQPGLAKDCPISDDAVRTV